MGTFENQVVLDGDLSLESFEKVVLGGYSVALGKPVYPRVEASYAFLEKFRQHRVIYGINTGFGPMAQYRISDDELQALQYNIIRSHATGCGKPLEPEYVRAAMLCRLQVLSRGRSGVHIEALKALQDFINSGFTPYVPRHGSVGASGDLVQMAHIALALLGEGELLSEGRRIPVATVSMSFPQYRYIHIREGLGETVKHACLADAAFFGALEDAFVRQGMTPAQFVRDDALAELTARRNCEIKRDFVVSDVHEGNRRMGLNLGHTIGRALETAMGYEMNHGECVAVGLALQARLGERHGYVGAADVARVEALLRSIGLPYRLPAGVSVQAVMDAMLHDKKGRAGAIRFVFQKGIGGLVTFDGGAYARPVDAAEVRDFLASQAS